MLIKRKSIEKEESLRGTREASKPARGKLIRKPKYAPVTLSEADGVRFLHFGTEWVQGAMRLRKPDWPELAYAQFMLSAVLFIDQPAHMVQLGLGSAALTKFCYRQYPQARVTAVELNPAVITVCESMFKLPGDDERLSVLEMDANDFVNDPANHGTVDALQIDLYDATARGPVLDSVEFYRACAACLTDQGVATVNLFGEHGSYDKNMHALKTAFEDVICLPEVNAGNVVAMAFRRRREIDFAALYERAALINAQTRLPAKAWVDGIK
ncbi:MAG: spermidine synthase, partial [Janthinobacterium lividum]